MALVKKLSKVGNARALLFTQDTMALLGITEDDELVMEFIGDTLLVRRRDNSRPDALELLAGLQRLSDTLALSPDYAEHAEKIKPEGRQRILLHLRQYGPSTAATISEALEMPRGTVGAALRNLRDADLLHQKEGAQPEYELNAEAFQ